MQPEVRFLRDVLCEIAKLGRDNPGYGYSCASKALDALADERGQPKP